MQQLDSSKILAHNPVMLNTMLQYLSPKIGELFLDCTFGAGGYSNAILSSCNCHLTALDQDPSTTYYAKSISELYGNKFQFLNQNFATYPDNAESQFNGIVIDLGVSSMQLDNGDRGFSFTHDGPLDMRMSQQGISAAEFVNNSSEEELADVLFYYGDETAARKIARNIVKSRKAASILTTKELASIVHQSIGPRRGKIDSATKTFQAIRIYINDELRSLEIFLSQVRNLLFDGGRLVIITFHSLEDRIVKNFFKNHSPKIEARSKYFTDKSTTYDENIWLNIMTKKPISPTDDELNLNPRSRSAKLRAAIKIGGTKC
jgi:16S rRNA (cytosine1402-N4)-methyltransferase